MATSRELNKHVDRGGDRNKEKGVHPYELFLRRICHLPDSERTKLIARYAQNKIPGYKE